MKRDLEKLKKRNEKLREMVERERENVAGYKQTSEIQNAFIAVLLNKLKATSDKTVTITRAEINEAMTKCDVRVLAVPETMSWELYCETK